MIFTDGITEARNSDGEEFGTDPLLAAVGADFDSGAERSRDQILDAVRNHGRGVPQLDDLTLIVGHVLGSQEANG